MAFISLQIPDLYERTFNARSAAFEFNEVPARKETSDTGSPYYAIDQATGREYYLPVTLGNMELPHPVLMIEGRKIIVETPLVERKGTVKEIINQDDYIIRIRGIILNTEPHFPEAAVSQLTRLFEQNRELAISNVITDIFLATPERGGSDFVVVKDFRLVPTPGVKASCGYELTLVSDEAFTLIEV